MPVAEWDLPCSRYLPLVFHFFGKTEKTSISSSARLVRACCVRYHVHVFCTVLFIYRHLCMYANPFRRRRPSSGVDLLSHGPWIIVAIKWSNLHVEISHLGLTLLHLRLVLIFKQWKQNKLHVVSISTVAICVLFTWYSFSCRSQVKCERKIHLRKYHADATQKMQQKSHHQYLRIVQLDWICAFFGVYGINIARFVGKFTWNLSVQRRYRTRPTAANMSGQQQSTKDENVTR